ncbi:molybdate ABC transporter ATP-binding protein ModF [Thorsellia anophelis]|uniref:Molybdate transport system ATP-binding protein n=1 Tax=Thorsellia anophelis DSM 18579 TaxID=1123402 RepID=A0A1I0DY90_9GAMM|nr:molybdate ABC transporter ATP-binding protein ModF [Thorsellia anophelis]SET36848.1 molybdate transport system ATP-binding protein [Thorsellia anophelis DSM 18579]
MKLTISDATYRLNTSKHFKIDALTVCSGDYCVIVGQNGSGKSAIAAALAGALDILTGSINNDFHRIEMISFEQIQKIINKEWDRNNTDFVLDNEIGKTAKNIILDEHKNTDMEHFNRLVSIFQIDYLLNRSFSLLSTGEMRKVFLCQKLLNRPDLLILDEPFDGLDIQSREFLMQTLESLNQTGMTIILVLNRFSDLPKAAGKLGIVAQLELISWGELDELANKIEINQLASLETLMNKEIPKPPVESPKFVLNQPKIILKSGKVIFDDTIIFQDLDWVVHPNQHWHIIGENGAGKSTLLSMISGDHPQGYSNDLTLFGIKIGSGETIWDIKKHIGYVSSSLHQAYRVRISARNVILSGFYDSIGLYTQPSEEVLSLCSQWIQLLNWSTDKINSPFHSLSWGEQRLILIVRAFVKHPSLLILDEPFQGLDALNREWVKVWISKLISSSHSQLIFVSHHAIDAPTVITNRMIMKKGKNVTFE